MLRSFLLCSYFAAVLLKCFCHRVRLDIADADFFQPSFPLI